MSYAEESEATRTCTGNPWRLTDDEDGDGGATVITSANDDGDGADYHQGSPEDSYVYRYHASQPWWWG